MGIQLHLISALRGSSGKKVVVDVDADWTFAELVTHLEAGYETPFRIERGKLNCVRPLYQLVRPVDTYERYGPHSPLTVGEASCTNENGYHPNYAEHDRFELTLYRPDDLLVYMTDKDSNRVVVTALERDAVPKSHEAFLGQISSLYERELEWDANRKPTVTRSLDDPLGMEPLHAASRKYASNTAQTGVFHKLWSRQFDMSPRCSQTLNDYIQDKYDPHFMPIVHVSTHRDLFADIGIRSLWQFLALLITLLLFVSLGVPGMDYGFQELYRDCGEVGAFSRDWIRERIFG